MIGTSTGRRNPFPGLRPFEDDQEELFFGRERHIDDLLGRLRRRRLIAVVGTSGSGKSSLVRAGLIPRLHGGSMAGAGSRWWIALMRPGHAPIATLADTLEQTGLLGTDGDERMRVAFARATLERGALGLIECIEHSPRKPGDNVLIVVDQFEELFRFAQRAEGERDAGEAAAFVRSLLAAAADPNLPIYVVITMRSEFLGDAARFRNLPETINDGLYLVPRLTRDQLRQAIEGPVGVVGAAISPRVVNQMLNDVGDDPDQLPILQHALMRTWDIWDGDHEDGEPIDLRHYRATGGLSDALSRHGKEIYDGLSEAQQIVGERLFKALTDPRGIRTPLSVRAAGEVTESPPDELAAVADAFRADGRSFLMPPADKPLDPDETLDLAHESLMRNWDKLVAWVAQEGQSAQIYARLVYLATEVWSNSTPDPSYRPVRAGRADPVLLHGTELAIAERWRAENDPNAAWARRYSKPGVFDTVMRFLDCSIISRRIEAEHRVRTDRIVRAVLGTAIAAALAFVVFGLIAVRSNVTAMLLLAFAAVGLASAAGGVVLGRRVPLAAGIGAVLFGTGVYVYAVATCIGFLSHNLGDRLVRDHTFQQWIALLPARARAPIEAGTTAALREEYNRVVSVDSYPWSAQNFSYATALIDFLQGFEGPANGHVLFFRAQVDNIVHKPESPEWRLNHTSIYDPWSTYLRNVLPTDNYNDLKQCWRIEGFCRERAGWILYVLADVNWRAFKDPHPHDLAGKPLNVDAAQRLRYLQRARADLAKSIVYYPPCAWVYEPPPAEMMREIDAQLAALHSPLPPGAPNPAIHCAEPRHDPFVDFVPPS